MPWLAVHQRHGHAHEAARIKREFAPFTEAEIDAALDAAGHIRRTGDSDVSNLNKVFLMGNLTRDPEVRQAGQTNVASFGLAINRKYKTAAGEQKEEVTFVDCDAFGRVGENIARYLEKGKPIFVEGHLRTDQWEKDGEKRTKLKVIVDNFQFIGGREPGGDGQRSHGRVKTAESHDDSDIPF